MKSENYNQNNNFGKDSCKMDIAQVDSTLRANGVQKIYNDEFVELLYKEFGVDGDIPLVDTTVDGANKDLIQKYSNNRANVQAAIMNSWHQIEDSLEERNDKNANSDKTETIDLVNKLTRLGDSCITNDCIATSIDNKKGLVLFNSNDDLNETEKPKEDYCQLEQLVLWKKIVDIVKYNEVLNSKNNGLAFPCDSKSMEEFNNSDIITYLQGILNLKQLITDVQSRDDIMHNINECNDQSKMKR